MSRRTVSHQRVLALHFTDGSSLLLSKSLDPTGEVLKRTSNVLLVVGGIGVAIAAIAGGMVASAGLRPVGRLTQAAERVAPHRRSTADPGGRARRARPAHRGVQHDAARPGRITGAASQIGDRRRARTPHTADVPAHQRRTADGIDEAGRTAHPRGRDGRPADRCDGPDRGIVHSRGRSRRPHP